jgi:hypothetical protein
MSSPVLNTVPNQNKLKSQSNQAYASSSSEDSAISDFSFASTCEGERSQRCVPHTNTNATQLNKKEAYRSLDGILGDVRRHLHVLPAHTRKRE